MILEHFHFLKFSGFPDDSELNVGYSRLGAMTCQCLYNPVMKKTRQKHRDDPRASLALNKLHTALTTCKQASPSFLYDFPKVLLDDSELNVNLQESYLRMHDTSPTNDLIVSGYEQNADYKELTKRAIELRRVLSRVPEEMSDRHVLETIKLIASSIKKLLEAINAVYRIVPVTAQPAVEKRKREFVHYSKRFSNTLKTYFKDQNANQVSVTANQLVFQQRSPLLSMSKESKRARKQFDEVKPIL